MTSDVERTVIFSRRPLHGNLRVPGDKSISHRALIVGAALSEPLQIQNLNTGADVLATADALRALGAAISLDGQSATVTPAHLHDAAETIDCRNSASTARMVLGVCAGANLNARFDGDAALRRRPMEPVAAQLRAFGARIETDEGLLPVTISGTPSIQTRDFILLAPSAQIKSALLFAALFAKTAISIVNDAGSRDHTERLLESFGANIRYDRRAVEFQPGALKARTLQIPGDFSAAAFFIAGATIAPGSAIVVEDIGVNPTRTGLVDALNGMGASISLFNEREWNNEPVADIRVEAAFLRGASIGSEVAARAIDDIPALAAAAARATGVTRIAGLRSLREKESDRLAVIARLLEQLGITVEAGADDLTITGNHEGLRVEPVLVDTDGDHRIAMVAAPLAAATGPVMIDDAAVPDVSFPNFADAWNAAQS